MPAAKMLRAEDLREQIGIRQLLGSYEMTEVEIRTFAAKWDPLEIHVGVNGDPYFGGVIASGVHTLAVYQRLAVSSVFRHWDAIAGRSVRMLLRHPVRPGDVLTGFVEVMSVSLPDARGRSTALIHSEVNNQHGRLLMECDTESVVRSRAYPGES